MTTKIIVVGTKAGATFFRSLPNGMKRGANLSNKAIAKELEKSMKRFAPESTGRLKNKITAEKIKGTRADYQVVIKPIPRWGSRASALAKKVYPIAQERGFEPHWIHTAMMPAEVRGKYQDDQGRDRFIKVRKSTPFALPAFLEMSRNRIPEKEYQKNLKIEMDKLMKQYRKNYSAEESKAMAEAALS
jgi:hypothetical protein